jgi:peroxiredoxin
LINDIYARYKGRGLQVYLVDIEEPADRVRGFVKRYNVAFPALLDADARVSKLYRVVGVPSNVLIGRDGNLVCNPCRSVEKLVPSVVR